MIGLRTNNDIDGSCALGDFGTFCLRNASCDRDHRSASIVTTQGADFGIDALHRAFTDMAGVQHNHICLCCAGLRHALRAQKLAHSLAIIDVHLTTE